MMPSIIYETLVADSTLTTMLVGTAGVRIRELQSQDTRPFNDGIFIIIDMQESEPYLRGRMGPRSMQIWVHSVADKGRDYDAILRVQNQIDRLIMPLVNAIGNDEVRLTQIDQHGRSGNLFDPAWKTLTRNALYGVLFDELNV